MEANDIDFTYDSIELSSHFLYPLKLKDLMKTDSLGSTLLNFLFTKKDNDMSQYVVLGLLNEETDYEVESLFGKLFLHHLEFHDGNKDFLEILKESFFTKLPSLCSKGIEQIYPNLNSFLKQKIKKINSSSSSEAYKETNKEFIQVIEGLMIMVGLKFDVFEEMYSFEDRISLYGFKNYNTLTLNDMHLLFSSKTNPDFLEEILGKRFGETEVFFFAVDSYGSSPFELCCINQEFPIVKKALDFAYFYFNESPKDFEKIFINQKDNGSVFSWLFRNDRINLDQMQKILSLPFYNTTKESLNQLPNNQELPLLVFLKSIKGKLSLNIPVDLINKICPTSSPLNNEETIEMHLLVDLFFCIRNLPCFKNLWKKDERIINLLEQFKILKSYIFDVLQELEEMKDVSTASEIFKCFVINLKYPYQIFMYPNIIRMTLKFKVMDITDKFVNEFNKKLFIEFSIKESSEVCDMILSSFQLRRNTLTMMKSFDILSYNFSVVDKILDYMIKYSSMKSNEERYLSNFIRHILDSIDEKSIYKLHFNLSFIERSRHVECILPNVTISKAMQIGNYVLEMFQPNYSMFSNATQDEEKLILALSLFRNNVPKEIITGDEWDGFWKGIRECHFDFSISEKQKSYAKKFGYYNNLRTPSIISFWKVLLSEIKITYEFIHFIASECPNLMEIVNTNFT